MLRVEMFPLGRCPGADAPGKGAAGAVKGPPRVLLRADTLVAEVLLRQEQGRPRRISFYPELHAEVLRSIQRRKKRP